MNTTAHVTISTEQKIKNLQVALVATAKECERDGRLYSRDALMSAAAKMKPALDNIGIIQKSHD